jgi:hypothetical protein
MTFDFLDEDGFISIVNVDKYKGFVDSDWQLDQLFQHFVDQMNNNSLIIWKTNEDGGNEWNIKILNQPSEKKEFRCFSFPIIVTNGCLYLVPYNDLTMVAQFENETVPSKHNLHLKVNIANGFYNVIVRQMFDPNDFKYEVEASHFEIIFNVGDVSNQKTSKIFWWT